VMTGITDIHHGSNHNKHGCLLDPCPPPFIAMA
jgi:hypothetical protein